MFSIFTNFFWTLSEVNEFMKENSKMISKIKELLRQLIRFQINKFKQKIFCAYIKCLTYSRAFKYSF